MFYHIIKQNIILCLYLSTLKTLSYSNNVQCIYIYICLFQTGAVRTDFYKDSDLTLGSVLNVWGRKYVICDLDDFTKEYYRTKFGIGNYV